MKHKRNYSEIRKTFDRFHDKVWPEYSERRFMDVIGRWWLRFHGFEHQGRIGPWRPDFVSHRLGQVIEIDGGGKVPTHDIVLLQEYRDAQKERDADLFHRGYAVLHLDFTDVRDYPKQVRALVKCWSFDPRTYYHGRERTHWKWQRFWSQTKRGHGRR